MTNNNRALAILWLDTGQYQTETVARNFNLSVEELETELAIFRCSPVYVQTYAAYIERQKQARLKECSFSPWRDNFTIRTLPNNRIECIVAEEHSKLPLLYHAYLPGKEYLDHICDKTAWVGNDAFQYVIAYEQVGVWKTWSAHSQLRFLVLRFDIAAFLPFRRTINYLEYERITGNSFPSDTSKKTTHVRTPEFKTAKAIDQHVSEANECAYKMQLAESLRQSSIRIQKGNDWEDHSVTDQEREVCNELISMADVDRLRRLADEGPCPTEWELLRYIDHFYTKFELLEPMEEARRTGDLASFKRMVGDMWEVESNKIASGSAQATPQTFRKPDWMGNRRTGHKMDMVQAIGRQGEAATQAKQVMDKPIDIEELFTRLHGDSLPENSSELIKQIAAYVDGLSFTEARKLYVEFLRNHRSEMSQSVVAQLEELLRPSRAASRDMNADRRPNAIDPLSQVPQTFQQAGVPFVPPVETDDASKLGEEPKKTVPQTETLDVMQRRKQLLGRLRQGLDPDLISDLQQTEREVIAQEQALWPKGFPERDTLLLYLYSTGRVKTEWGMTQRIMVKLSNDEVNEFLDMMSKGGN